MVTKQMVTRSLPAILLLMAISVILMLAGSSGTGFVLGLVVVGIAAVLLGSMFIDEVGHSRGHRQRDPRSYRRTPVSRY
jgi:fatty acid desaturase